MISAPMVMVLDLKPFGANQGRMNIGAACEPVLPDAGTDPSAFNSSSSAAVGGGINELELDSIAGSIRQHARQQSIGSYSFNSDVSDLPLLTAQDEEEGHRGHAGDGEEEDADDDDPLLDQHRSVEEDPTGTETRRNERPTLSVEGNQLACMCCFFAIVCMFPIGFNQWEGSISH